MARETYQESLDALREDVVAMGDLVVTRLDTALSCLDSGDEAQAREVMDGDDEINERYLSLEDDCIELFALQEPIASDLRFVAASFKILTDIERVGDLATNIAGYAIMSTRDLAPPVALDEIGQDAKELLERSLSAYETGDAAACRDIVASDDAIDALSQQASETVTRDLIERESGRERQWRVEQLLDDVASVLLTIRDLERVADHGVNIAARTLYMVENDPELIY
ncbi:phosphate signaling complex protein PhoU [Halovenus marina]|uniref:phosphate signaling complex protein PhoU n=1 Tax=Halovenus marina TaxID=3396621 RepID=UPI003F560CB0